MIVSYEYRTESLMHPVCIVMSISLSRYLWPDLAAMVDHQTVNQTRLGEFSFAGVESIMHAIVPNSCYFRVKSVQCHRIRSK